MYSCYIIYFSLWKVYYHFWGLLNSQQLYPWILFLEFFFSWTWIESFFCFIMMKLKCFFYGFSYLSVKHRNRWYCLLLFLLVVSQCYLEWVNNLKNTDHGFIVTETHYLPEIAVGLFFSCTVKVNSSYMMPLVNRFIGGTIPLDVIPLILDWNIKSFMRIGYMSVTYLIILSRTLNCQRK